MYAIMFGFVLILTRVSGFLVSLPIFGWPAIPVPTKVLVAVVLSAFFYLCKPMAINLAGLSTDAAMLLLMGEAIYGLALGIIVAMLFSAVALSGRIAEQQMGMTMSEIVDPLKGEESGELSGLMDMIFILLFLSADGHHLLLLTISKSYDAFPPGTAPTLGVLVEGVVETSSVLLMASLRLAAPLLGAFLVLMVALALLARLVPEMDILTVTWPARVALGLFLVAVFLPFVAGFVTEIADWMAKLLPI
ncbi:MAG: flagellar biosynthetic protein FliR [Phycisphaerales bacterium]|jgi:flagellar biosynthetic protein FliR